MSDRKRVLIVDDDSVIREFVRDICERRELEVVEAQGLAELKEALTDSHFDLIISDFQYKDGTAAMLPFELKNQGIETPYILMSGFGGVNETTAKQNGAAAFLVKPFRRQDLEETIRALSIY